MASTRSHRRLSILIAHRDSVWVDQAKQRLIGLASHTKEEGGGVAITRFWKRGNIEYKRIPALTGIDLDAYRGPDREEIRVLIDR